MTNRYQWSCICCNSAFKPYIVTRGKMNKDSLLTRPWVKSKAHEPVENSAIMTADTHKEHGGILLRYNQVGLEERWIVPETLWGCGRLYPAQFSKRVVITFMRTEIKEIVTQEERNSRPIEARPAHNPLMQPHHLDPLSPVKSITFSPVKSITLALVRYCGWPLSLWCIFSRCTPRLSLRLNALSQPGTWHTNEPG
jgi:hypothetical protein